MHVAEGLGADTDSEAQPWAKTFHGASSRSPQLLIALPL
ncbi:hypothetical protein EVA_21993, partial [gut metagenome]